MDKPDVIKPDVMMKVREDVARVCLDEAWTDVVREALERFNLKNLESFPMALVTMAVAMLTIPEKSPYRKNAEAVSGFLATGQMLGSQFAEVIHPWSAWPRCPPVPRSGPSPAEKTRRTGRVP